MLKKFKSLFDIQQAFFGKQTCINHLEELRWANLVTSPFDPTSKVYRYSNNRYCCKNTYKYFNVKTGTLFDNTKVKLQKTTCFMFQRIHKCFNIEYDNHLDGDEAYY